MGPARRRTNGCEKRHQVDQAADRTEPAVMANLSRRYSSMASSRSFAVIVVDMANVLLPLALKHTGGASLLAASAKGPSSTGMGRCLAPDALLCMPVGLPGIAASKPPPLSATSSSSLRLLGRRPFCQRPQGERVPWRVLCFLRISTHIHCDRQGLRRAQRKGAAHATTTHQLASEKQASKTN